MAGHGGQQQPQRQMGDERVEIPGKAGAPAQADHALQRQHQDGASHKQEPAAAGPFDLTEGGRQHNAKNAHRGKVAQGKGFRQEAAHSITCFRRKAYSRYCRRMSEDLPWGMGICTRLVRVTARLEMFWTYSMLTRNERCGRRKIS